MAEIDTAYRDMMNAVAQSLDEVERRKGDGVGIDGSHARPARRARASAIP